MWSENQLSGAATSIRVGGGAILFGMAVINIIPSKCLVKELPNICLVNK